MLVGFYQFEPTFGAVSENLDKIEAALTAEKFDLLVLPELCTTGYQFVSENEVDDLAETLPDGAAARRLIRLARDSGTHIVAGLAEKENGSCYNSAIVVGPSGLLTKYRKIHLFFEETLWFTPGSDIPEVLEVNGARVGTIICFDWLFPEIFRILALAGADLIAHPSNLVLPYCQSGMQTRSIENRIFTVTANRTGTEERGGKKPLTFTGRSQVTDTWGKVLVSAHASEETLKVVEIDPLEARDKTITPYNTIFGSRRPELYREALTSNKTSGD